MGDYAIELLKELGGFTIIAQTLVHLSASKKFEQYISLLISTITIVIIITPILDVILYVKGENSYTFSQYVEQVMESYWSEGTALYDVGIFEDVYDEERDNSLMEIQLEIQEIKIEPIEIKLYE